MINQLKKRITHSLLAGVAQTDITPPLGTFINGDFVAHYACYVHDHLFSKALVLKNDITIIAIIVVDICVMPKEFADEVKYMIADQTGIPFQNILISSTHTHAAGSVESVYLAPADIPYTKKLPGLILQSVQKAMQKLRPAKTAFGKVDVPQHVRCRRYFMQKDYLAVNPVTGSLDEIKTNPFEKGQFIDRCAAQTDPQVSYLAVKGTDDKWISIMGNYSLHYVGDWENGTISADYFGEFSRQIEQKLQGGDDFVGMMSNGTSGDINIWDFEHSAIYPSENFKKSELIGKDIAEKVFQSLHKINWDNDPVLKVQYEELPVGVRKPLSEDLEKAKKMVSESNYENIQITEQGLRSIYAREQILLNEYQDVLLFPLQAIRIGGGIIGGLGGEIFAETGLWLKDNCPFDNYFTVGLANANCGYLPPAHEMKKGGYETWRSRTSKLEADAEEKVRKKQLELISKLGV
jgi:neutral ceramidase